MGWEMKKVELYVCEGLEETECECMVGFWLISNVKQSPRFVVVTR